MHCLFWRESRGVVVLAVLLLFASYNKTAVAQSSTFVFKQWAGVQPVSGWSFVSGEFTGEALDDLVGYFPDENDGAGELWLGTNTGSGFDFGLAPRQVVTPVSGWIFTAGKFVGHRTHDVMGYFMGNEEGAGEL